MIGILPQAQAALQPGLLSFLPSGKIAVVSPFLRRAEPDPATKVIYAIVLAELEAGSMIAIN